MDRTFIWRRRALKLAAAALVAKVIPAPAAEPLPPIRLALIESLSGPFANTGEAVFRNILWAVERVNARGGVALRPGDGIIHSWLNRLLLPDTVGTGGDSHTRFPIGISFPAGSGLVAFGAATGVMPLDMPESVLVRFKGTLQPGITLRDTSLVANGKPPMGDLTNALVLP